MEQDGEYAPLGPWVGEFMRQADKANQAEAKRRQERLDALNARADERAMRAGDEGEQEALGRMYHAGTAAGGGVSEFHPVGIDLTT